MIINLNYRVIYYLALMPIFFGCVEKVKSKKGKTLIYEMTSPKGVSISEMDIMYLDDTTYYEHFYRERGRLPSTRLFRKTPKGIYLLEASTNQSDSLGDFHKVKMNFVPGVYYSFLNNRQEFWSSFEFEKSTTISKRTVDTIEQIDYNFKGKIISCYKYTWSLEKRSVVNNIMLSNYVKSKGTTILNKDIGIVERSVFVENGPSFHRKVIEIIDGK